MLSPEPVINFHLSAPLFPLRGQSPARSLRGVMDYYTAVRAFIRVVEGGSFTKASTGLDLPRNTVTKLVQALEAHLQVKLLNRTTRRVSLTNDGAAYYERMSRIMDEWQEAESDLAMSQSRPRGRIRVDVAALLATHLVIPALPTFYERYPDIQLDLGVSDKPSDLVSDRIDCVLRAGKVTDPSLIAVNAGQEPPLFDGEDADLGLSAHAAAARGSSCLTADR